MKVSRIWVLALCVVALLLAAIPAYADSTDPGGALVTNVQVATAAKITPAGGVVDFSLTVPSTAAIGEGFYLGVHVLGAHSSWIYSQLIFPVGLRPSTTSLCNATQCQIDDMFQPNKGNLASYGHGVIAAKAGVYQVTLKMRPETATLWQVKTATIVVGPMRAGSYFSLWNSVNPPSDNWFSENYSVFGGNTKVYLVNVNGVQKDVNPPARIVWDQVPQPISQVQFTIPGEAVVTGSFDPNYLYLGTRLSYLQVQGKLRLTFSACSGQNVQEYTLNNGKSWQSFLCWQEVAVNQLKMPKEGQIRWRVVPNGGNKYIDIGYVTWQQLAK